MNITTHQETDLWQFNSEVIHRRTKKVIFQPRICCWYDGRKFLNIPLPEPYTGMTLPELYKALGVSNRYCDYNSCQRIVHDPRVRVETEQIGPRDWKQTIYTPKGNLTQCWRGNTSNGGSYTYKWPVTSEEEMEIHRWVLEHATWEWDWEKYEEVKKVWEFAGLPQVYMDRVNVQYLLHNVMGIEDGIFSLYDYPEEVEKYFQVMHEFQDRQIDMIIDSPLEIINFGDNIHSGILPPNLFEQYVLPEYQYRTDRFRSAGVFTDAHWDGDVKPLLPYAKATGLDGIEAVTPLPQGDVTLREIKEAFGDDIFLLDGVAALLFDPNLYPMEDLEAQTRECLELFGGQLILGISDELASTATLDRVVRVREIVDEYNAQITE